MVNRRAVFAWSLVMASMLLITACDDDDNVTQPDPDIEGDPPALVVEPDTLSVDDDNQPGMLYLATFPPGEVTWRLAAAPGWVTVLPDSGLAGTTISAVEVTCDGDVLSPGVHHARLEFISTGGSSDVALFFNVQVHPVLAVSDTLVAFGVEDDQLVLTLDSTGTGAIDWNLEESADWLIPSRTSGFIYPGTQSNVQLVVDRAGLAPGSYSTTMNLTSNSEDGDIAVRVTLEVASVAILALDATELEFGFFTTTDTVHVMNSGNAPLDWTAGSDQAFVTLDLEAGTVAVGGSAAVVVAVDRTGLDTGTHTATLTFAGPGQQEQTVAVSAEHFVQELTLLDYRVVDAEYDRNRDVIVAVAAGPNRAVIRDPESGDETSVDLALAPTCVSIQPGGAYAAVGHDAYFSLVDLAAGTVENTFAVTTNAVDIVLADNGYCYVFPRTDQWETIRCIELATGVETTSGGYSIRAGTLAKLHPSGDYIYGADNGLSPSDFEKYDIRAGTATLMYDSPYHGDYAFSGNIWIADDGLRLFARSGNVFRSSTIQAEDMTYNGSLAGASYLQWVEHSTAAGVVLAIPAGSYYAPAESEIRVYGNEYLALQGVHGIPPFMVPDGQGGGTLYDAEGRFVFVNQAGDRFHALVKADDESGLLNDWAAYGGDIVDLTP